MPLAGGVFKYFAYKEFWYRKINDGLNFKPLQLNDELI